MNTKSFVLQFQPVFSEFTEENGVQIPTKFRGVAYSGGLVRGHGFLGDTAIDLSGVIIPKSLFMLVNHDSNQRAGRARAWIENNQLMVEGEFSKATESGRQVALECSESAPWGLSVGVQSKPELFQKSRTVIVNGKEQTVNSVLRSPRLREISFVPVAADENAAVVSVFSQSLFSGDVVEGQEDFFSTTTEMPLVTDVNDEFKERLNSVSALNADLQVKLSAMQDDHSKAIAELNVKLCEEAKAHLSAVARANELQAELNQFKSDVRLNAVKALFADLHREYSAESAKTYCEMSDEAFAVVANDLRSLKPSVSNELFKEFAVKGQSSSNEVDMAQQLFQQVAGVK